MSFNRLTSKFLINKKFQFKLVGILAIPFVISCGIYSYFVFDFFQNFKEVGENSGLPTDHIYFEFVKNSEANLAELLVASFSATLLVFFAFGMILSHKVAGPMYRLRQHLLKMSNLDKDELEKISFRKGDFFKDIEEAYNDFVIAQNNDEDLIKVVASVEDVKSEEPKKKVA